MAGITGQGTTYTLPNYVGELFGISPEDTPFLSAIGGLTGGESASAVYFPWQTYDLRDAAVRARLEGANAPTATSRVRAQVYNICQIVQEAVEISYTKLAAVGQYGTGVNVDGVNPVTNELSWQLEQHLKQVARDIEYSMINGEVQIPSDNTSERKMRGILEAISTNVSDASGAALTETLILDLMQDVWDEGGISEQGTATIMCNSYQKRQLSKIFLKDRNTDPDSRTVGGVNLQTIETDFGRLNVMLNRYMPTTSVAVVSLEQCAPVFLEIPGKGFLFAEPLAKEGAAERSQIYGEVSLKYGNEKAHGKIIDLADSAAS